MQRAMITHTLLFSRCKSVCSLTRYDLKGPLPRRKRGVPRNAYMGRGHVERNTGPIHVDNSALLS